jgi:hypothetical protein
MTRHLQLVTGHQNGKYPFIKEPEFPHVVERDVAWRTSAAGAAQEFHDAGRYKALVGNHDGVPYTYAITKRTYKLVQMNELCRKADAMLVTHLTDAQREGVIVNDKSSYHGGICTREYIFPKMKFAVDGKDIAFRIIMRNGYGSSAINWLFGAIQFWCSNGMIIGQFEQGYAKHTAGIDTARIVHRLQKGVAVFQAFGQQLQSWAKTTVTRQDAEDFIRAHYSARMAEKVLRQLDIEFSTRGYNVFALYSALTYASSHNEGDFAVKETKNDHTVITMLRREEEVAKLISTPEFLRLIAA